MSQPNGGPAADAVVATEESAAAPAQPAAPSLFLQKIVGEKVVVRLSGGIDYVGVLSCLDGFMNIALEDTEEHVGGQVKNRFGDSFIRGNNGLSHRVHTGNPRY